MAFGIMQAKWSILKRPLTNKLHNIRFIVMAIAKLHNFTVMESNKTPEETFHELYGDTVYNASVPNRRGRGSEAPVVDRDDRQLYQIAAVSKIREDMVVRVERLKLKRGPPPPNVNSTKDAN